MVQSQAEAIAEDSLMCEFFKIKRAFYALQKQKTAPKRFSEAISDLKSNLTGYTQRKYGIFYDILFIDANGDVFYTIRKQADYHQNVFTKAFSHSAFVKRLRENAQKTYVDYQYYEISGEPSAFFIVPMMENSTLLGWFVPQCAINKINQIFSMSDEPGKTLETFLVNRDHYMLTDSRFMVTSTILKKKLSHENIASKFRERRGHKSIVDYRGKIVLSSFEVFPFGGTEWLIIAKIDRDEVLTEHYKRNRERLFPLLLNSIRSHHSSPENREIPVSGELLEVDMDEYRRNSESGKNLYTHGVSTCTSLAVLLPGRVSYLSHISPYDRIYGMNKTDILGRMMQQITHFELRPYEKNQLDFIFVARHLDSFSGVLDTLLQNGIFLSQIKFLFRPDCQYANIYLDQKSHSVITHWYSTDEASICGTEYSKTNWTLAQHLEEMMSR